MDTNMCKEIKQDMDELSEFQENIEISCIKYGN